MKNAQTIKGIISQCKFNQNKSGITSVERKALIQ